MRSFHFPPSAANAAVRGQPWTAFVRARWVPLPAGSFLSDLILGVTFKSPEATMIIEVRTYKIKPGKREEFLRMFETEAVPAQRSLGIKILGPLIDLQSAHTFVFLLAFPPLPTP